MKTINIKSAIISAIIIWTLGVFAYVVSYLVPVMSDPDVQANWVLSIALIPIAAFGTHIYYRKEFQTNGILLGVFMFLMTIVLDACITVPVFMIPAGINHLAFFGDPGFWFIGLEYVCVVGAYWKIKQTKQEARFSQAS